MSNETPNPYSPAPEANQGQYGQGGQPTQMGQNPVDGGAFGAGYGGSPYGGAPDGKYDALPPSKFNVLAIVAFISAFFIPIVAVVTGHISLSQIKKTGDRGRGLAIWGTVLGYIGIIGAIIATIVLVLGSILAAQGEMNTQNNQPQSVVTQGGSEADVKPVEEVAAGDVSAEFCDALTKTSEASSTGLTSDTIPEDLKANYKALSELSSPSQASYIAFYDFLAHPENFNQATDGEKVKTMMGDFYKAVAADSVACAMK